MIREKNVNDWEQVVEKSANYFKEIIEQMLQV